MAGNVNRVPQGLLSLLDMKAAGENPRELANLLAGVLDLTDLYLSNLRQTVSANVTPAGTAFISAGLGPSAGEIWYVRQATCVSSGVLPAAAFLAFAVGYQPGGVLGFFIGMGPDSRDSTVGERPVSVSVDTAVLQPGDLLGAWVSNFAGVPGNVRVTANIARLSI